MARKINNNKHKQEPLPDTMASIAIMVGGAALNAAAFIGGNYLAQYVCHNDP